MIFNTALAILALAAPALAGGIPSPSPSGIKLGCMTDQDCSWGESCVHNICVAAAASSKPPPPPPTGSAGPKSFKSTVTKHTTVTSTITTCSNGACSTTCPIYTCWGDSCDICTECEAKAEPTLTVTVIECSSCEGGYTTSTCYPDVTVTVTACNTCLTSSECTTSPTSTCTTSVAPVPVYPSSSICTTTAPVVSPTMPVWYSGANRAHVAYGGLVGIVAVAAFML
jgi:hypothetical protein